MEEHPSGRRSLARAISKPWSALGRALQSTRFIGWSLATLLLAIGLACAGGAALVWASSLSLDRRMVGLGDIFTMGAFALAVLGSIVALLAYRFATQRPALVVHITTEDFPEGTMEVGLGPPDPQTGERPIRRLPGFKRDVNRVWVQVSLENTTDWSARNVAVRVDFNQVRRISVPPEWDIAAQHQVTNEVVAAQWEGGATHAVHGRWTRHLKPITLTDAIIEAPGDNCFMTVEVVAEGFRDTWKFPILWHTYANLGGKAGGAISGYTGYPSSGVPPLTIYAIPTNVKTMPRRVEPVLGYGYRWFWFDDLEPGDYHVLAYQHEYELVGGYTVGARDDNLTASTDHTLVPVVVKRGDVTDGVEITDWYYDKFPAEPKVALGGKC